MVSFRRKSLPIIYKVILALVALVGLVGIAYFLLNGTDIAILNPKGEVANRQMQLIIIATLLGLIVVVPVFVMLFYIAWRYREGNTKAKYMPEWKNNNLIEAIWWGVPFIIIVVLGIVTWQSSHELDPYKPLTSEEKPVKVQVVALQWRWLFIYPDENIASINELHIPVGKPVNFEITADAPMNSFWIPKLGGQVYAMTGMSTKLHLKADEIGNYEGRSANISGEGFADMKFMTRAVAEQGYKNWVQSAKQSTLSLESTVYEELAQPSKDITPKYYLLKQPDLYDTIVMKYMDMSEMHMEGHH
jgi:cytochrome o ubiquinol oxidase subunit II